MSRLLSISFYLLLILIKESACESDQIQNILLTEEYLHNNRGLSLPQFETILSSEASEEFYSRHLSAEELDSRWNAATAYQWKRAHDIENGENDRQLLPGKVKRFPFIVCDTEVKKSGNIGQGKIKELMPKNSSDISTMYNKDDKTCFLINTKASVAEILIDASLVVQPLLPEMKLRAGIVDRLQQYPVTGAALTLTLCPGYFKNRDDSDTIIAEFMEFIRSEITRGNRRNLGMKYVLREDDASSSSLYPRRQLWRSVLEDTLILSTECAAFFDNCYHTISLSGEIITITLPPKILFSSLVMDTIYSCALSILDVVSNLPEVCSISLVPEYVFLNQNAQWITQSGVMGNRPFFKSGLTGKGQVVAISDSGLEEDSCYFRDWDNEKTVKGGFVNKIARKVIQYVDYGDDGDFNSGHGTHVVGTIAGKKLQMTKIMTETNGTADGIAPDAQIAFFDILNGNGNRISLPDDMFDLFNPGMLAGARVHSVSWGSKTSRGRPQYHSHDSQFDKFMYENREFLVAVASGNNGKYGSGSVATPATGKNCLSVGSSQSEGPNVDPGLMGKDYLSLFSARGPTEDGRIKPDIIAPGEKLTSVKSQSNIKDSCDAEDKALTAMQGTSMAAPVVSGNAILIREYFQEGWHPTGKPTEGDKFIPSGALVKAVLLNGARYLKGVQSRNGVDSVSPYDINQGFGRLNLITSLHLADQNDFSMIVKEQVIKDQQTHEYNIKIDTTSCSFTELSITLVWMDPPSPDGCQSCLLNDLDLSLQEVKVGHAVFPNGLQSPDRLNNAERIRLEEIRHGENYAIRVDAYDLSTPYQEYALVVTGCIGSDTNVSDNFTGEDESQEMSSVPNPVSFVEIPLKSIQTPMVGKFRHDGNMFDIRAKNDIIITSLDIHTQEAIAVEINVWTKLGSLSGFVTDQADWDLIFSGTVQGKGKASLSILPSDAFNPISVCKGDLRAFYVTDLSVKSMRFDLGSVFGSLLVSNEEIEIFEGVAMAYPFKSVFSTYNWNGKINYKVHNNDNCRGMD